MICICHVNIHVLVLCILNLKCGIFKWGKAKELGVMESVCKRTWEPWAFLVKLVVICIQKKQTCSFGNACVHGNVA